MRYPPSPEQTKHLDTNSLRAHFLVENLFTPGNVVLNYWNPDHAIVGSAVPTTEPLPLESAGELDADFFTERREVGVLNIGPGPGTVT
jgi:4-deoxy-L-threo-5-hexosulose-uronate ketol-isomerase